MVEPSIRDIDALVGPATPHFALQIRARVRELIQDLPNDHPVRRYGEEKMRLLEDLALRLLEGRAGRQGVALADRLGGAAELRAGVRAAAEAVMSSRAPRSS